MYHVACLSPPFNGDNLISLGRQIVSQQPKTLPSSYSSRLHAFISRLLAKKASDRPTAQEMLLLLPSFVKKPHSLKVPDSQLLPEYPVHKQIVKDAAPQTAVKLKVSFQDSKERIHESRARPDSPPRTVGHRVVGRPGRTIAASVRPAYRPERDGDRAAELGLANRRRDSGANDADLNVSHFRAGRFLVQATDSVSTHLQALSGRWQDSRSVDCRRTQESVSPRWEQAGDLKTIDAPRTSACFRPESLQPKRTSEQRATASSSNFRHSRPETAARAGRPTLSMLRSAQDGSLRDRLQNLSTSIVAQPNSDDSAAAPIPVSTAASGRYSMPTRTRRAPAEASTSRLNPHINNSYVEARGEPESTEPYRLKAAHLKKYLQVSGAKRNYPQDVAKFAQLT